MKKYLKVSIIFFMFFFINNFLIFSKSNKYDSDINIPKWYLNPPSEKDKLFATGYAKKKNLQLAMIGASDFARGELSRMLKVEISTIIKQFLEQSGINDKTQITEFSEITSTSLTSNILYFSKIEKQEYQQSNDKYIAFVLIKLDLNEMKDAIEGELTKHADEYKNLNAKKELEDLENKIKEKIDKKFNKEVITQKEDKIKNDLKKDENKQEEKISSGKKPDWIINYPISTEYYIGIGNGSSLQQAKDQAINTLVTAIEVKIKSEINEYLKETNSITEEQITENIKLTVKDDIEDLEIVELWNSEKEGYWAYYRLNIEKYKTKQQEKINNAKLNAVDFLKRSDEENDPSLKFKYAFLGYYLIGKYISRALKVEYQGKEILIVNELTSRMQKVLNNFDINTEVKNFEIDKINPTPLTIIFNATYSKLPVKNFPVKFNNNKGKLDITEKAITDQSGKVSCIVNKAISSELLQSFIIQMDLNEFIKDSTENEEDILIYYNRISKLGVPSLETIIKVNPPVFGFELQVLNDLNINKKYLNRVISMTANFKNSISKNISAKFTDENSKLKLQMIVDGTITQSENSGNYYTRLIVTINIIDGIKNEQIFTKSTPAKGIKGGSTTEEKSVNASLDIYMKDYNDKMIEYIMNFIEGK